MRWRVTHACVRGAAHERNGLPNQDAVLCTVSAATEEPAAIAVVSDGHGGASHFRSQIGSSLAVTVAAGAAKEFLPVLRQFRNGSAPDPEAVQSSIDGLSQRLVAAWRRAVDADIANQPFQAEELGKLEAQEGEDARKRIEADPAIAYGATLLLAAATDTAILYLQLGDGEILAVNGDQDTMRPLPPDERLIGNQTTSLCQPEAWRQFRSVLRIDALPSLVLLSSDGYANSFRTDEDFLKIGSDYLEILREQGIALLAEELPDILSEASRQGSGDDITLAVLENGARPRESSAPLPVRPRISPETKSTLIQQLKVRHSSQRRQIEELNRRMEEEQRKNRRLWLLLLVALLAMVVVPLSVFRHRIFGYDPAPVKPPVTKPPKVPAPAPARPAEQVWRLDLSNGSSLNLRPGGALSAQTFHADDRTNGIYAAVDGKEKSLVLKNRSQDTWVVTEPGKKVWRCKHRDSVKIVAGVKIVFTDEISGTLQLGQAPPAPGPEMKDE